jgi:autophagy-related protein 16
MLQENQLISKQNSEQSTIIQVLKEEMQALQLELLETEERAKELEEDNKMLLERWLKKVNEDASKMNENLTLNRR